MIYPERMSKLFIVGPNSVLKDTVSKLHNLKAVHISEHKKGKFDILSPPENFENISRTLVSIRSIISHLKIDTKDAKEEKFQLNSLEYNVGTIKEKINKIMDESSDAKNQISKINDKQSLIKEMDNLSLVPDNFIDYSNLSHYFGYIDNNADKLKNINKFSKDSQIIHKKIGKKTIVAAFISIKSKESFEKILADIDFLKINTEIVKGLSGSAHQLLKKLENSKKDLEEKISRLNVDLDDISKKHSQYLINAEEYLSNESEKAQIWLSFGKTSESFFLNCFVPKKELDYIKKELLESTDDKLHIVTQKIEDEKQVPIKLNNPRGIRSFEFLTKLYSLPSYNEIDPTFIMAFTFPLFFGFMLGDVGYGLITFILFYLLKKKIPKGADLFNILIISSIATIIFGVIYGEVLGFEPWHGLIVRTHDINTLMFISIIAGIVHVNLGLVLGFIIKRKEHGFLHAAYEKLSWIILQISFVLLYLSYNGTVNFSPIVGYSVLAISIIMLIKGEGFLAVIEIPSIISHIVSYARLMAVGLASVFLAVMVNDFAGAMFAKGVLFFPVAIIGLVLGHGFNIALGVLSPALHSVRLHYVEFFTKFYSGEGIEYAPFGAKKQESIF